MAPLKASRRQLQAFHSQDYLHFLETHGNQSDSEKEDDETAQEMEDHGLGEGERHRSSWGYHMLLTGNEYLVDC